MTGDDIGGPTVNGRSPRRRPELWFVGFVALLLLAVLLSPFLARREGPHPNTNCLANVKYLATALNMYVMDYDAPPDSTWWCDRLSDYVKAKGVYKCPQAPDLECGYALNTGIEGASKDDAVPNVPGGGTVTIFESNVGWNAHGGKALLPKEPRHMHGDNYGFLDGHSKWFHRGSEGQLRWEAKGKPN